MIKSQSGQLAQRGFVEAGAEGGFAHLSETQRLAMLKSALPTERTIAARLLRSAAQEQCAVTGLVNALRIEKKLYPKIEICDALVSFGELAVEPLTGLLGQIGHNQHARIPEKGFRKQGYPLPRDITARTLIRIGTPALPALFDVLRSDNLSALSEAIDAIGHICFYTHRPGVLPLLKECFEKHDDQTLIKWKIVRAMSAFPQSHGFLQEVLKNGEEELKPEAKRSLQLISTS
ncbi:MAG: HEAT repeat domain-containing protein [Breznakibacter sp.]